MRADVPAQLKQSDGDEERKGVYVSDEEEHELPGGSKARPACAVEERLGWGCAVALCLLAASSRCAAWRDARRASRTLSSPGRT